MSSLEAPPQESATADGFESEAGSVLQQLRRSVTAVLAAVPELNGASSATDVQRSLRINSKLSWQVHKFATTPSPLDVAIHLPKPIAMKRFCDAAKRKAVPSPLIEQVLKAVDAFGDLVKEHAGDRATFDAMVGSLRGEAAASQLYLQHRRDAFRAQGRIWGLQAKAVVSLMIFRAGTEPGTIDGITIGGRVNMRRFRRDARCVLYGRCVASDKRVLGAADVQPLFPADNEQYGAPMLGKFCDTPTGKFHVVQTEAGVRYIEAAENVIGNKSAVTYMSGEIWRNVDMTHDNGGTRSLLARARTRLPTEVLYHDVMVHRDLAVARPPDLHHFGDLRAGDDALAHDETERLPHYEPILHLGRGAECVFAPEYPRYPDLAQDACVSVGWDPNAFDVYRCHVPYPVLPSTLVMRFPESR